MGGNNIFQHFCILLLKFCKGFVSECKVCQGIAKLLQKNEKTLKYIFSTYLMSLNILK